MREQKETIYRASFTAGEMQVDFVGESGDCFLLGIKYGSGNTFDAGVTYCDGRAWRTLGVSRVPESGRIIGRKTRDQFEYMPTAKQLEELLADLPQTDKKGNSLPTNAAKIIRAAFGLY